MEEIFVSKDTDKDTIQLKKLNRLAIGLIIFIMIWTVSIFLYIDKKTEEKPPIPILMIDPSSGKITNMVYSNFFPTNLASQLQPSKTNEIVKPLYEQKDTYDTMEFVIINYFFIGGMVVDKSGNNYTIMYRDYNRVLQKVIVPREMLLTPTSSAGVNPASLLGP